MAGREDVELVAGILEEAAAWLHSRGIDQWPAEFSRRAIAARIRQRECHLGRVGAESVGTFSLQGQDPEFWGDRPPEALYLHGLAVRRGHAGRGRELLTWAEAAAGAAGRRYLRLDCNARNPALCAYYEGAGFRLRGGRRWDSGWESSLYEKEV